MQIDLRDFHRISSNVQTLSSKMTCELLTKRENPFEISISRFCPHYTPSAPVKDGSYVHFYSVCCQEQYVPLFPHSLSVDGERVEVGALQG